MTSFITAGAEVKYHPLLVGMEMNMKGLKQYLKVNLYSLRKFLDMTSESLGQKDLSLWALLQMLLLCKRLKMLLPQSHLPETKGEPPAALLQDR